MGNWYVKAGTVFNDPACKFFVYVDLGGYAEEDYETRDDSHLEDEDPYIRMGGSGGAKEVEIGLSNDYRIKVSDSGIEAWDEVTSAWVDLIGGGIAGNVFKVINCPAGTDPVAVGPVDTLILTSGNNILTITGDVVTNTVGFTINEGNISHDNISDVSEDDHHNRLHDINDPLDHIKTYLDLPEIAVPASPDPDTLRLFVEDFKGFSFFSFKDSGGMVRKIVRDSVFVGKAAENIAIGDAVYAFASSGNVPEVKKAKADALATMPCIGIAIESIVSGAFGRVMQVGLLENFNTNAFNEGDVLYVDATTAGALTVTAPLYPNIRQEVGVILVKGIENGAIQCIARSMFNEGIIDHQGLLNILPDSHHNEAHNIASHSDTTATGAELETLTNTSDADALHTHGHSIHDNVAAEISAIANKATPVAADYLLIEDSEAADAKKHITIGDLPSAGGGYVDDTAYDATMDGDTTHAPSRNVVYDKIEAFIAEYEADQAIGAANAQWQPLSFTGHSDFDAEFIYATNKTLWNHQAAVSTFAVVPLPTNKGSRKLYIDKIRIGLFKADANDYISQIELQGIIDASSNNDELYVDPTNYGSQQDILCEFGAEDCSGYLQAAVGILTAFTSVGHLQINYIQVHFYYDD